MFPELTTIGDRLVRLSTTLVERIRTWTKRAFQVNIIKTILSIQLAITLVALSIQLYALCSAKWALFHSRVELGIIEEHGHYGLWTICTYRKLIPAEVDDDGHVILNADCDPLNTFFRPGYSRTLIATFAICHTLALLAYFVLVAYRLGELCYTKYIDSDLEISEHRAKKILALFSRIFPIDSDLIQEEEYIKRQIRYKLYAISGAVVSTLFALLGAITPRRTLRETDMFQIASVADSNYRVWRGPGFWAQLTTMVMDMLITCLIVIEVRVLFVLQRQPNGNGEEGMTSGQGATDDSPIITDNHRVQPFFRANSLRSLSDQQDDEEDLQTAIAMQMTRPKILDPGSPPASHQQNPYIAPKEIREQKRLARGTKSSNATSYCNPMFCEENNYETILTE